MPEQDIHNALPPQNHVHNAGGQSRLNKEVHHIPAGKRAALVCLQNNCIAAGNGNGKHPERNHSGEIKWEYPRANAERLTQREKVHLGGDVVNRIAQKMRWRAAGKFNNLNASINRA